MTESTPTYGGAQLPRSSQSSALELELAAIISARRGFRLGTVVTNCVVHADLRFDARPRDCELCRADLVNAIGHAARINLFLNDLLDRLEKAVQR